MTLQVIVSHATELDYVNCDYQLFKSQESTVNLLLVLGVNGPTYNLRNQQIEKSQDEEFILFTFC